MMYACSVTTKRSVVVLIVALAVVMSGQGADAQPGWVLSHQKVSSTQGGGPLLGNGDTFGRVASLGDLDGDGIGDLAVGAFDGGTEKGRSKETEGMKETTCSKGGQRRLSRLVPAGVALGLASWTYGQCENDCGIGDVAEGEDCLVDANGQDVTNGGCNWDPIVFGEASCGTAICGTVSTYDFDVDGDGKLDQIRDLDWYRLSPTELAAADTDGNGVVQIQATLTSEFPGVLFLAGLQGDDPAGCDSTPTFDSANSTPGCGAAGVAQAAVILADNPNGVVVIVSTGDADGGIFDGIECAFGANDYILRIECIELPEACAPGSGPCGEPNGTPGCEDPDCCAVVCATDPACCLFIWDEQCALAALEAGCAPPDNDLCEDAIPIFVGPTDYDTTGANTDGLAHDCCQFGGQAHHDIWYNYTSDFTGDLTVSTCNQANYNTFLMVYDGCWPDIPCPPTDAQLVACSYNTGGCAGSTSRVTVSVVAGNCYLVRVGGGNPGNQGQGTLSLIKTPVGPGACCLPDGSCLDVLPADCTAAGGGFQGAGTTCARTNCSAPMQYDFFFDQAEFEAAVEAAGMILKGVEDADWPGVPACSVTVTNDPIDVNGNEPGWYGPGDITDNLSFQSNVLGCAADVPAPAGDNAMVLFTVGLVGAADDGLATNFFANSFDILSGVPNPENHTAMSMIIITALGGSTVEVTVFDKDNVNLGTVTGVPAPFTFTSSGGFFGIIMPPGVTIGRVNICDLNLGVEGVFEVTVYVSACPADFDNSGDVGVKDLLMLLGAWGPCPPKGDCPADFDNSSDVGVKDLLVLLGAWGPCP